MSASAATFNQELTSFASGVSQDKKSALANFIAPVVPVGIAHGQYKKFDDKNAFQVLDTSRAVGGNRKRIEFAATDPFFNTAPQGLETTIDDHERQLAGANISLLQESKISNLVGTAVLSHEKKVFDALKAGLAATASIGVWSDATKDPVAEIDSQIEAIANYINRMPNKIVFGLGAWRVFRNHPLVIKRQPGADLIGITGDQAARMTINPGIQVMIGMLGYDQAKFGATKNATNIVGGEVFLFYGQDSPDLYDPSFMKTFAVTGSQIDAVREYREERAASDVYYVDWSEDIQIIASAAGRRITLS